MTMVARTRPRRLATDRERWATYLAYVALVKAGVLSPEDAIELWPW
jgi:hypothetical protein